MVRTHSQPQLEPALIKLVWVCRDAQEAVDALSAENSALKSRLQKEVEENAALKSRLQKEP